MICEFARWSTLLHGEVVVGATIGVALEPTGEMSEEGTELNSAVGEVGGRGGLGKMVAVVDALASVVCRFLSSASHNSV